MIIREMRPHELHLIVRIYVNTFKATHQGIVSDTFVHALSYENALPRFEAIIQKEERRPFCSVAEEHDNVVGYALAALAGDLPPAYQAYQAELKTMYILPAYHRMGIGRNLIRTVAEHLHREMVPSLFVGTFRDNYPARRFYEALGARPIEEYRGAIGGEEFMLATYGWASIPGLLQLLAL
jgi:ribosomal protein S18 acetylase RimI-like enzyme